MVPETGCDLNAVPLRRCGKIWWGSGPVALSNDRMEIGRTEKYHRPMANWFGARSKEELIDSCRALSRETDDGYGRWLLLIKELRVLHDASILEAERIALSNAHRRRWVEKQINTHQRCRKYALAHIRHNGDASLIDREGDTFRFKVR
jgi:hypothetical protein